jgi:ubiquinone/menaquinone biosynthesis C-methylase UbiE
MPKQTGAIATDQPPLDELFRTVLEAAADEYDPWLYRYCGNLTSSEEADRYRRHLASLLAFGRVDVRGKNVLDAGCGFGFTLLLLRWLGASEVSGVDTSEAMIETVRAFLPLLPEDIAAGMHVEEASVSELPYEDDSFDVILSIEAISHYRDVGAFVAEAARVLRTGGTLLVRDGNNSRNPRVRRETQALWEEFETGKASALGVNHERQGSYRLRREEIIREAFPEAPDAEVEDLVSRTAFMNRAQIVAAIGEYRAGGAPPASFYDGSDAPVDPNSDAVIERLFDPYQLAELIADAGFETRVAGYWGGASGNRVIRLANGTLMRLSRVAIASTSSFMIAARRL